MRLPQRSTTQSCLSKGGLYLRLYKDEGFGTESGKKGYAPEEGQDPRLGTGLSGLTLEADQAYTPAALPTATGLPLLDMGPGALVHGVVDGHNDAHVWRFGIVVLACHC